MVQLFTVQRACRAAAAALVLGLAACSTPEERAQSFLSKAEAHLAKGEDVRANIEFRNAIKNKKDLLPAWRGIAKLEEKKQNWAGLVPILRTVVELDPADLESRLKLGKLLALGGGADQALQLVNAAADAGTRSAGLFALRAGIMFRLRDSDAALRDARRALEIDPANIEAQVILAVEQLTRRDAGAALATLEQVKDTSRAEIAIGLLRLQALELLDQPQRIEAELRRLIEVSPDKKTLRRQLVRFYMSKGRELDAEKEVRAAAEAEPANAEAGLDVVRFMHAVKGADAARGELDRRIRGGGDVFAYELARAQFEHALGNHKDAIASLEKLIATTQDDKKLKAQVALATILSGQKSFAAADPIIADILGKDKRNIDGLRLRAIGRIERGQLDNAIADLREALNDHPTSTELMRLIAVAHERNGAMELAEKHYADATRTANFAPGVALQYVSFLQRRGNPAHVEDVVTEITTRFPTSVEAWTALAQIKLRKRDWIGANQVADTIAQLGGRDSIAAQIRGEASIAQNKLDESIQALQSAMDASPTAVQPMYAMVRAYLRAQKPAEAENFLNGVLKASPANAEAHVLLGSTQLAKGAGEDALKSFKAAIALRPKNAIGYAALADYYVQQGNDAEAMAAAQAGLKEQPTNFGLRLSLAGILERRGDIEAAIREYETLLAQRSDSLIAANNLASLLSDYRADKESLERAQTLALMLQKSNVPHFKDTMGWVHYQRREYRVALPLLEEAAVALPNLAGVRYHLGMTLIALGQREKGLEQLQKASELESREGMLKEKIRTALKQS